MGVFLFAGEAIKFTKLKLCDTRHEIADIVRCVL